MPLLQFLEPDNKKPGNGMDGLNKGRAAVACLIVGTLIGLMVGYGKKWNLIYSGGAGAAIGGAMGLLITKNNKE